jgi:predicted metalloprotease
MRRGRRAAVLVAMALLAACGGGAGLDELLGPPGGRPSASVDADDDEVLATAFAAVERYWTTTFPEVYGGRYRPIAGGLHPYGPDTEPPPCGRTPPPYELIAGNAFYCAEADLIAWDTTELLPDLLEQFGTLAVSAVMAHEVGHAVQQRARVSGPTIMLELQADCFAGAWAGTTAPEVSELDRAIAGFIPLRDQLGVGADDPQAHGSAFDRIGAFQDGFDDGAARCADYEDGEFTVVDLRFQNEQDFLNQGNAPYDEIDDLVIDDLEDYWASTLSDRFNRMWTSIEDSVRAALDDDDRRLRQLYDELGDFAVGTVIAEDYSRAAQERSDLVESVEDGAELLRQADCLTGTWVASAFRHYREDARLALSPGDLDEAVGAFLRDHDRGVSGFDRTEAFREGFLGGIDACD